MDKKKSGVLHYLANLDLYLAGAILCALIAITFIGVIYRYCFGNPLTWLEEVQLACLTWIGFLAAGPAFRRGAHIAIEMVVEMFPQGVQKAIAWCVRVIVLLLLVYLTKQCVGYCQMFIQSKRLTPVLRIPYAYVYAVPAISCVIMVISFLCYEMRTMMKTRTEGESHE